MRGIRSTGVCLVVLAACTTTDPAPDLRPVLVGPELATEHEPTAAFRATSDGWRATHGALDVHHDGARLTITPVDADGAAGEALVLGTPAIELDGVGAPAAGRPVLEGGALVRSHGAVAELVTFGVESLLLRWTPRDEVTELVVRIPLAGHRLVTQTATGLHFAPATGGPGFVVGDATWASSAGESFVVATRWEPGELVLEVPPAILAAPGALKLTVNAERQVDAPITGSPTGAESRSTQLAFSGAQYLAVWQDQRAGNSDIYGTRLSTTGAVLDTRSLAIATGAEPQVAPTVAVVGAAYLVVWENRSTGDLEYATVTPSTGVVTPRGAVAATPAVFDAKPQLAARGSEALLVWESTGGDVFAARFAGGTFGAPVAIAATPDPETEPAVAANPAGGYLVAFTRGTVGRNLHGQLVTAGGTLAGTTFDIATSGGAQFGASLAFAGGNYIAVWAQNFNGLFVHGARISPAGAVLDQRLEAGVSVNGLALTTRRAESLPRVACTTVGCFVAWRDQRTFSTTAYDLVGRLFGANLVPLAAEQVISGGAGNQILPHVTPGAASGFVVSFSDERDGRGKAAIATRVDAAGTVLDPAGILLARGFNRQLAAGTARSNATWLLAWGDSRVRGNNILGVRVNNAGNVTDSPALNVSNAPGTQATPAIAVSGAAGDTTYLTVWSDTRNGTDDIFAARVPETGAVLDPTGIAVAVAPGEQLRPEIAGEPGGRYLVVWQDRQKGTAGFDIRGAVLDVDGQVIATNLVIATAARDQITPVVAFDRAAGQFFVVWSDKRSGVFDLYGTRVTVDGAVLDPDGIVVATSANAKGDPSIAFGTDRLLVVWGEGQDVAARTIRLSGGVTLGPIFAVSTAPGRQSTPNTIFLGDDDGHFAVVWSDTRADPSNADVYGTQILEATGEVEPEFVVSANPEAELRPTLSRGRIRKQGRVVDVLVGYQRFSPTALTDRVMLRRLVFRP